MIRRKASLVETAEQGWCVALLLKKAADGSESLSAVFESAANQEMTEQPSANIKFEDGNPEVIPVFE